MTADCAGYGVRKAAGYGDAANVRGAPAKKRAGARKGGGPKKSGLFHRLADLYARMEEAYRECASAAGLSCAGCASNCCASYFQHHTHVEWAYLWRGIGEWPEKHRKRLTERARVYLADVRASLSVNEAPTAMCPLNENGQCSLYAYRLMICRLHGTRNILLLPGGRRRIFSGCARFSSLPCAKNPSPQSGGEGRPAPDGEESPGLCPTLDRTPFYAELAALELEFCQKAGRPLARVDLTLAEMIVLGPTQRA